LLALAEQVMQGTLDHVRIGPHLNRAHALADVAGEDVSSRWYCSWCVYEAALRALGAAWAYDQVRACCATNALPPDQTDCTDDASTYAAVAVVGGMWHPSVRNTPDGEAVVGRWDWQTEEAQLRRAVFWEWWLREAVPVAWRMVDERLSQR
jgi:hypothetical protein